MSCVVCGRHVSEARMCSLCTRSYDRDLNRTGGGDVIGAIIWAANRARRFERQRVRHERVRQQARRLR
jgi:hypothetical protein